MGGDTPETGKDKSQECPPWECPPPALAGIRVLDLSRVLAGPYCTMILGDLGAEVIKVERPGEGGDTRHWGPPFASGESAYYLCANRNKKSVTVDMKTGKGKALLRGLAEKSDILIENFRVGALAAAGLGYEEIRRINPRIVYCSITGFGQTGPWKDLPGYDFILQAMSGLMSFTGEKDGEPMKVGVAIVDLMAGLYAAIAILSATATRTRTSSRTRCSGPGTATSRWGWETTSSGKTCARSRKGPSSHRTRGFPRTRSGSGTGRI